MTKLIFMIEVTVLNIMFVLSAVALAIFIGLTSSAIAAENVAVKVLSGRPDMVTGGDVLIGLSDVSNPSSVSVFLNGHKIDAAVRIVPSGGNAIAYIKGLSVGENHLKFNQGNSFLAKLKVINYPITGPVFSGPHQEPFICQTEVAGLGEPIDSSCSAKTTVDYIYKSTQTITGTPSTQPTGLPANFKSLDVNAPWPTDIAQIKTSEGNSVDFVIRRERGTINRAIYEISFLHEPGSPLPSPWSRPPSWNGRLIYNFGGDCRAGYHQGMPFNTVNDAYLTRGYAVVASSLNWFGNNCNDVLSAETAMMVKEYFIDHFGVPIYTIGAGASGGSMQQHLIVQNYPGILNGIMPGLSYPDITTTMFVVDCSLTNHAFSKSKEHWSDAQKTAVAGFSGWGTCKNWIGAHPGWVRAVSTGDTPREGCSRVVPRELIYHPQVNPSGARCSVYDSQENLYGQDPITGFAYRPFDNIGVQYGLVAFNTGIITAEQFIELNALVGGYDHDGNIVDERSVADLKALRVAYGKGRVNSGAGGLGTVPIIDWRPYLDSKNDFHDRIRSLITRARLIGANGHAKNHVIITGPEWKPDTPYLGPTDRDILLHMEEWLDALVNDTSRDSPIEKIVRAKPKKLNDACFTETGDRIVEPASFDGKTKCNELYPPHTTTRMAAGGPITDDILKCTLKPFDPSSYTYTLSRAQIQRLKTLFKHGVCDYERLGVAQGLLGETWVRY